MQWWLISRSHPANHTAQKIHGAKNFISTMGCQLRALQQTADCWTKTFNCCIMPKPIFKSIHQSEKKKAPQQPKPKNTPVPTGQQVSIRTSAGQAQNQWSSNKSSKASNLASCWKVQIKQIVSLICQVKTEVALAKLADLLVKPDVTWCEWVLRMVLCRTRGWTWWFLWVPSNVIL